MIYPATQCSYTFFFVLIYIIICQNYGESQDLNNHQSILYYFIRKSTNFQFTAQKCYEYIPWFFFIVLDSPLISLGQSLNCSFWYKTYDYGFCCQLYFNIILWSKTYLETGFRQNYL